MNGVSEGLFKRGLCLPSGPYVTDEDVRYIVNEMKKDVYKRQAYDVPSGPRDIVQNGYNGYLIQELNNESFELQVSKLMESETLRKKMGKNAILKAQEFEFAKILDLWKRQL